MYKIFRVFFLFFMFFVAGSEISALESVKVDEKSEKINLSLYSELFVDAQNHFSYEAVSNDSFSNNFRPANLESIATGYTNDTIWVRFSVMNEGEKHFSGKIEMPIPWIDRMEAYIKSGERLSVVNAGIALASQERHIDARSFFLPIEIEPLQSATIYIKTKSQNAIILAPSLYSQKAAAERLNYMTLFNGVLIGIVLIMILYNFINYIALRNRNYLYYGFYLAGLFLLMGTYYGYNTQLFYLDENIAPLTVAFSFLAALLFAGNFIQIGQNFPKSKKYLNTLAAATLIFGFVSLMVESGSYLMYSFAVLASLIFLFLFSLSAAALKKEISGSLYLLFAWIFLGAGELAAFLMTLGFISYNRFVYDSFAFAAVLNILMISSALVFRNRDEEAQHELKVQEEHELADKLNLSKKELRDLNEKFQRKIARLEAELLEKSKEHDKLSVKDDTTGLYKKSKLEEILTNELHRSKRYDYLFGIIVVNIDGLKNINEKHGYEVGNSVMKEMADLLMRHIRYLDTVGRWSDTEYLIICPETNTQNTFLAAEHLQSLVEKSKFFFVGSATASFGVTSSKSDDTLQDIMARGYEALALAKENGRNRAEAV